MAAVCVVTNGCALFPILRSIIPNSKSILFICIIRALQVATVQSEDVTFILYVRMLFLLHECVFCMHVCV